MALDTDPVALAVLVGRGRFRGKIGLRTSSAFMVETYWLDLEAAQALIDGLETAHEEVDEELDSEGRNGCPVT